MINNLPNQPYKKFFGRRDAIDKIKDILLEGGTFIASIDGVGGIGKTALAYHFCREILIPMKKFDYLIWITSKKTVFDPFSREMMIKSVQNEFHGIETLIDTTLSTVGFEEYIDKNFNEKKDFFETEVVSKEKIFFILDNLENIDDTNFFDYLTKDFNKFSAVNRNFKVLTTSRKRKKIIDFPIEIEGLDIVDALSMLKYLANELKIKDILKASEHDNVLLIEKVGNIPLGIEFIIGQMALKRSRGEIYQELEGYPSLKNVTDENEKKKRLSDIIMFSFKDMYETLDEEHQHIFKIIAALQKNRKSNDEEISFELLMNITNLSKIQLDKVLEDLMDNKLIISLNSNCYNISQMAINFVRQNYDDFEDIEDEVIGLRNKLLSNRNNMDKIDLYIEKVKMFLEDNKYEEAEGALLRALDTGSDYRLYYELAKIQRVLNKFSKATDNFEMATHLNPKNVKVWYDWINMVDSRKKYHITLEIIHKALDKTNNDISIVKQMINLHKYKKEYDKLRKEVEKYLSIYENEARKEDYLNLLREWKSIEYTLYKEDFPSRYIIVVEKLISKIEDKDVKLQLLKEQMRVAEKKESKEKINEIKKRVYSLENNIKKSISQMVKKLNWLFNQKQYQEAKKEARKILSWYNENEDIEYFKNSLRVLLQIFATEKDYDRIISTFEDYKEIGYQDTNSINILEKAQKTKIQEKKNKLIKDISLNIQNSEFELRNIIMWSLEYDEEMLKKLVRSNGKEEEWLNKWELARNKALKKDISLIHYSDMSHLRAILQWCRKDISKKIPNDKPKYIIEEEFDEIKKSLEKYINSERNETFHSRLQLYDIDELYKVSLNSSKLFDTITNVKYDLGVK